MSIVKFKHYNSNQAFEAGKPFGEGDIVFNRELKQIYTHGGTYQGVISEVEDVAIVKGTWSETEGNKVFTPNDSGSERALKVVKHNLSGTNDVIYIDLITEYGLTDLLTSYDTDLQIRNFSKDTTATGEISNGDSLETVINKLQNAIAAGGSDASQAIADAIDSLLPEAATVEPGNYITGLQLNQGEIELIETALPAQTDYSVTVVTVQPGIDEQNILKKYQLQQNGSTIGTIDIPKDLVVTSGSVVVAGDGTEGTEIIPGATDGDKYIKLVIANQTTPIYINVKDLVDIYSTYTFTDSTEIDFTTTEASGVVDVQASIVAGSLDKTKFNSSVNQSLTRADSAITRIATTQDANVLLTLEPASGNDGQLLKATLSSDAQASLTKADNAILNVTNEPGTDVTLTKITDNGTNLVKADLTAAAKTALSQASNLTITSGDTQGTVKYTKTANPTSSDWTSVTVPGVTLIGTSNDTLANGDATFNALKNQLTWEENN